MVFFFLNSGLKVDLMDLQSGVEIDAEEVLEELVDEETHNPAEIEAAAVQAEAPIDVTDAAAADEFEEMPIEDNKAEVEVEEPTQAEAEGEEA